MGNRGEGGGMREGRRGEGKYGRVEGGGRRGEGGEEVSKFLVLS